MFNNVMAKRTRGNVRPTNVIACICCGASNRPLMKLNKTLSSSARICNVCAEKYIIRKGMGEGVNNEADRLIAEFGMVREARCLHCGKSMGDKPIPPPLWCEDCEKERRRIEENGRRKRESFKQ